MLTLLLKMTYKEVPVPWTLSALSITCQGLWTFDLSVAGSRHLTYSLDLCHFPGGAYLFCRPVMKFSSRFSPHLALWSWPPILLWQPQLWSDLLWGAVHSCSGWGAFHGGKIPSRAWIKKAFKLLTFFSPWLLLIGSESSWVGRRWECEALFVYVFQMLSMSEWLVSYSFGAKFGSLGSRKGLQHQEQNCLPSLFMHILRNFIFNQANICFLLLSKSLYLKCFNHNFCPQKLSVILSPSRQDTAFLSLFFT